jgi:hypothetical protein
MLHFFIFNHMHAMVNCSLEIQALKVTTRRLPRDLLLEICTPGIFYVPRDELFGHLVTALELQRF